MTVREWAELCSTEEFRAPGVHEVGSRSQRANGNVPVTRARKTKKKNGTIKAESTGPDVVTVKEEPVDDRPQFSEVGTSGPATITPPRSVVATNSSEERARHKTRGVAETSADEKPKARGRRNQTKEQKEANRARDLAFVDEFDPRKDWLPPGTKPSDYTVEFCQELERTYWRNLGIGRPAWYGADSQGRWIIAISFVSLNLNYLFVWPTGSLFTDETTSWNVAHLPSALSRLLPASDKGLPGVNTPYLYFGMWRATFAWHVEDMDLFSINYIHFGAPKFWYAIPQGRSGAFEQVMRGEYILH